MDNFGTGFVEHHCLIALWRQLCWMLQASVKMLLSNPGKELLFTVVENDIAHQTPCRESSIGKI
jgi:hypothetical protein